MKLTLLYCVQSYLRRTGGFYVDSIFETDESQDAAGIAEEVFYEMYQEYHNILSIQKERTLHGVSDPDKPNYLLIPSEIQKIDRSKIYYNISEDGGVKYHLVEYLTPNEFLEKTYSRASGATNTEIVEGFDRTKMVVENNKFPSFCTSFDGQYLTFDSYNKEFDTTLHESKTKVVSTEMPSFLIDDDFIIPVPEHLSSTYLNMFNAECYSALRQEENPRLNSKARRARIKLQQDNRNVGTSGIPKKRYGRRGSTPNSRRF